MEQLSNGLAHNWATNNHFSEQKLLKQEFLLTLFVPSRHNFLLGRKDEPIVTMRQLVLTAPGQFFSRDVNPPSCPPNCALVRINSIGVCGSDFHAFAGRHPAYVYPRVIGHELAGTVIHAEDNEFSIQIGDRCAIEPYVNCGDCSTCRMGRPNCCERLEVLGVHRDGGMQEILAVPYRLLHRSATLSPDELALVETLGIGSHAVARSRAHEGEATLVIGAGPIGLGTALFARAAGCRVTVVEPNQYRREFAQKQGFDVATSTEELSADIVFDATGNAKVMAESLHHVAPGGRLIFVGLTSNPVILDDSFFHKREITLLASRNSAHQFPRILRMMENGEISVKEWITDRLTLSEVATEFAELPARSGLIKAIVSLESNAMEEKK
jgi:2-desacetyl-2-hydroxyethyl bacteriochlorophyllide A dehydrogenase